MTKKIMHIGLDDTDSTRGGCTTYVAALLVEKLQKMGVQFIDYPSLVRLNPNVPWKTRGNGALCLRIKHDKGIEGKIKETVVDVVEDEADLQFKGTDPGIVFFDCLEVPAKVKRFSRDAITGIVKLKQALKLVANYGGQAVGFNECRGIIGALAAVGETFDGDYTFEVLAYRRPENFGLKREVDEASVFEMDKLMKTCTFNNVDYEKRRVVITPRGPDPILFGIRGETAKAVKQAMRIVRPLEPIERWVVFRTNQGTDAHLTKVRKLSEILPYHSVIVKGTVSSPPRIIPLRHVIFSIEDGTLKVDCAAYEPTGSLRKAARELIVGDQIEVYGAVRRKTAQPLTINLEKIRPLRLARKPAYENPFCDSCGKRLKSMGTNQGFECQKCGARYVNASKVEVEVERKIKNREFYVTSTRSQRHLAKPLKRYGVEKHGELAKLVKDWHSL